LPEVQELRRELARGEVVTTGLVLQEILQGLAGPRDRGEIISHFDALPMLAPDRNDHVEAAQLRNACRREGVQIGTIDALLAQLCIQHTLMMLTTDRDFVRIAELFPLKVWTAA
jgi:hypothetical protein